MSIQSEENKTVSGWASWAILLAFCAAIVGWGLLNKLCIHDRPRQWNFGALPDTPAQSIYSSANTQPATAPTQILPLPRRDLRGGSYDPNAQPGGAR